ncbi:unnamed protein product [Vitrella brassicaformis CCMP3155]|uniref:BTB domain-containing protein n=2 Tax=Vitrella brassicaformis TaxID=1169539 RepID=A0A0G4G7R6_VITBC|nr:unnamed protein product [Vitrella brassicaformis CCMP3155]|eukprot:CEM24660.1 unnamed protein product [Vitrella brassicaformis CCMP3155]
MAKKHPPPSSSPSSPNRISEPAVTPGPPATPASHTSERRNESSDKHDNKRDGATQMDRQGAVDGEGEGEGEGAMSSERPGTPSSSSGGCEEDVIELNVGGERMSVLRSTLCQCETSLLTSMFSGRWEAAVKRDKQGSVFLDFDPDCFKALLNFLRNKRIEGPGRPAPRPIIPKEKQGEFGHLLQYLGMTDYLFPFEYHFKVISGAMRLSERCVRHAGDRYSCAIMQPPVNQTRDATVYFKAKVHQLGSVPQLFIGLIGSTEGLQNNHSVVPHATCYGWGGMEVIQGGRDTGCIEGWGKWREGDVAVVRYSGRSGLLAMVHRRMLEGPQLYKIPGLPRSHQDWYICVSMVNSGDTVEIMPTDPTEEF